LRDDEGRPVDLAHQVWRAIGAAPEGSRVRVVVEIIGEAEAQ
jgi:hypothetical protein